MQQVVEEFSSATDSDLSDLVSSMASELNMDSMRERLSAMVHTEMRNKLRETDLDTLLKGQFSQTAATIEEEIKRELQEKLVERSAGAADALAEVKGVMTIIPFRFGCVYSNPSDVKTFIDEHENALSEALLRLKDRSEFGVRVGCDVSILKAQMEKKDADFDNSLNGISEGVASFLKSEISKDADSSDALLANIRARIHDELQKCASEAVRSDTKTNLTLEKEGSILNATYLVPISGKLQFKMQTSKIATEFEAFGIQIEVNGPWPPYHFIDIDLDGNVAMEGIPV